MLHIMYKYNYVCCMSHIDIALTVRSPTLKASTLNEPTLSVKLILEESSIRRENWVTQMSCLIGRGKKSGRIQMKTVDSQIPCRCKCTQIERWLG